MDPMLCMIIPWPGTFAPLGWSYCQGQTLTVNQYQAVFSLLGNLYGGSPGTNFKLPDLRGRTIVGASLGTSPLTPYGQPFTLGSSIGGNNTIPTALQSSQIPPYVHTHTAVYTPPTLSSVTATLQAVQTAGASNSPSNNDYLCNADYGVDAVTLYGPKPASAATVNLSGVSVSGTLSGGGVSIQPTTSSAASSPVALPFQTPVVVMNYLIALEGLYPTRP